ncbi:MAG: right-handed parallel beta-helix repeat-containing protein [Bacteroidetes bacterium]|nr:right-handed parallel beta-helix repeat-containing protein [Bacteroidota bacterium]
MKLFSIILILVVCCSCKAQHKVASKTIDVYNSIDLQAALNNAKAGDHIVLKDGIYNGNFIIPSSANGTSDKPITLSGSKNVILDGNTIAKGYVLHLQASYWIIKDITITNGLKGLMCDGANYNTIDNIAVNNIGEEGIHFRKFSSHNVLQNSIVTNTGLKTADYGEGVYIGTAVSNWSKYTNGLEDKCDSNKVINNTIGPNITAECIDVKEGSTGGVIRGNHFNSKGITGANSGDSWMDVKGNGYLIENNTGFNPTGSVLKDGYQVHCAVDGWGNNNKFKNNISEINVDGYGINVVLKSSKGNAVGNIVYKNNVMKGLNKNIANIELTD